jgi:hypothetical protein
LRAILSKTIWIFGQNLVTDVLSYELVNSAGFCSCITEYINHLKPTG